MPKNKKNNLENKKDAEERINFSIKGDVKRGIIAVFLVSLAMILILSFFSAAGILGEKIDYLIGRFFGWGKWLFPLALVFWAFSLLLRRRTVFYVVKILGMFFLFLSLLGFFHIFFTVENFQEVARQGQGGGYFGYAMASFFVKFTGKSAGIILLFSVFLISIIAAFDFSLTGLAKKIGDIRKKKKMEREEHIQTEEILSPKLPEKTSTKTENVIAPVAEISAERKKEETAPENSLVEEYGKNNIKKIEFLENVSTVPKWESEPKKENLEVKIKEKENLEILREEKYRKDFSILEKEWEIPPLSLLDDIKHYSFEGDVEETKRKILKTFDDFGISMKEAGYEAGPSFTQYRFTPGLGVKLSRIVSLVDNLSLNLAKYPIRIEAPIPGKSLVGIEVPNEDKAIIGLREFLVSHKFRSRRSNLLIALGKSVDNEYIFGDLAQMPHLLIAGSTGTGKSVCVNSILVSLLYQNSPEDLKLILVDPKRVELYLFQGIPHLLTDVIVENKKVVGVLRWAVKEMEDRYQILQKMGVKHISRYNEEVKKHSDEKNYSNENEENKWKKMPYIVIVIDELADIMLSYGKEVEGAIARLTQMARAVGIHLIVSTQRPSVNVLTGLIKSNIIHRISLKTASQIDSRTILNMGGAEKLLGKGDMLYLSAESANPKRLQGVYVSEKELKNVINYLINQEKLKRKRDEKENSSVSDNQEQFLTLNNNEGGELNLLPKSAENEKIKIDLEDISSNQEDELYEKAKELVLNFKKASATFLQRRLRIGYSRAARILDIMEENGIIGPSNGAKPREILVSTSGENSNKASAEVNYEDASKDQKVRDKWQI